MAEDRIYLTVDKNPKGNGLLAVISQGQPQLGDDDVVVLDVTTVKNMKAARKWYKRMLIERPWELRN